MRTYHNTRGTYEESRKKSSSVDELFFSFLSLLDLVWVLCLLLDNWISQFINYASCINSKGLQEFLQVIVLEVQGLFLIASSLVFDDSYLLVSLVYGDYFILELAFLRKSINYSQVTLSRSLAFLASSTSICFSSSVLPISA